MVDYAVANQIRPFQLPDLAGTATALQAMQLNQMRAQQLQSAEQERVNIRNLMATPGFDISSPDAANRLLAVAPTTGAAMYQALMAGQRERRQAQVADLERGVKFTAQYMDMLSSATPENYHLIRAAALRDVPNWAPAWPEQYSPDAVRRLQSRAADSLLQYRTTITASPAGGFVESSQAQPYGTAPLQGPRYISPENILTAPAPNTPAPAPNAPAPAPAAATIPTAGPPTEGGPAVGPRAGTRPGMTPGQTIAAGFLRRAEDYRGAPYYDQNAYRAGYGSDTTTLADGTVVPVRQGMTISREDAERDLARRIPEFTQRAAANIGRDRFEALPPNAQAALISIAYNYGHIPESIRASARSGDLAALARDVAALPANPGRRRQEAAMIAGANAMVPGAAPVNAMLAPQDATAVTGMPQLPTFTPPRTLAEAEYQKRMMDAVAELEKKRIEAERRRGEQPERVQEAGQTAEATARGQAVVRRAEQPARVEEAGQTVEAQERARIQTREAEARRAEAEKLNTAISELERISRPGGLLERSTGGGLNAIVDRFFNFFNAPTTGAVAIGSLAPIADIVLKMVPRFEGPQSDKDTASYQAAAGQLADPNVPNETRIAAAREILRLFKNRRDQFSYSADGAATAATTGAPAARAEPPQAAPQYREGQRAVGPNGQRIEFRNGQWVPIR